MRSLADQARARAAAQHALITRHQATALGASPAWIRHRLRTGEWVEVHRGVYRVAGAPVTQRCDLLAALWAVPGDAWGSHQSAAALVGLPGFSLAPAHVTIAFGRQARALATGRATVHRSGLVLPHHVATHDAIPVTSTARTLFDLCGAVHPKRAERALDTALAHQLTTIRDCWTVLLDLAEHGRAGTVLMRDLLLARGDGWVAPASEIEARFVELLRAHDLPQPRRQVDLGDEHGWIGRVDFYFDSPPLVVETDGRLWHTSRSDRALDRRRDERLRASGREVVRYTWADVTRRGDTTAADVARRLHLGAPPTATRSHHRSRRSGDANGYENG